MVNDWGRNRRGDHDRASPRRRLVTGRDPRLPPAASLQPSIYLPGDDLARVLVLGDGSSLGFGLVSSDRALPGRLASSLAASTSRGVVVDVRTHPSMTPERALDIVREVRADRYHAIVVALGMADAARRTPPASWARHMSELLDHIIWAADDSCPIVVGTVPHAPMMRQDWTATAPIDGHAVALNRALDTLPEFARADVVRLEHLDMATAPVLEDAEALYRRWAAEVVAVLLRKGLPVTERRSRQPTPEEESRRLAALRRSGILDTATDDRFDGLVAQTQRRMSATVAALSFIDEDRLWVKSIRGFAAASAPRGDTLCDHTIRDDGTLVIPDAASDPRFAHKPFIAGDPHFRFYAGHPIESPDGERIGSLCVLDGAPRHPSREDIETLQSFALRVQRELYLPRTG